MKTTVLKTLVLSLLLSPPAFADSGWEKDILVSASESFQPLIRLKGETPVVAYEKKETDGTWLHVISMKGGLFEKFLLSQDESFHEYDLAFVSNTIYIVYASSKSLQLIIKNTVAGTESRSSLDLPNIHGPSLLVNPTTGKFHLSYIQIQDSIHGLHLYNASFLSNALDFSKAKLLIRENHTNLRGSFFPKIAFDGKSMHLVFTKRMAEGNRRTDSIYLMSSMNDGSNWNSPRQLSKQDSDSLFPSIDIPASNQISISFVQTGPENRSDLVVLKSMDATKTFTSSVFSNFKFPVYFPAVFTRQGQQRLIAYDYSHNNHPVLFEKTFDVEKGIWTNTKNISATNSSAFHFRNMTLDDHTYITWQNNKGEIRFIENDTTALPPKVYSTTIDTNYEYPGNSPDLQWNTEFDVSGIHGYAYMLDNFPDSMPDIENLAGDITGRSFNTLNDGTWYFHIRTIDNAGNWSEPSHFKFVINTQPLDAPIISSKSHREYVPSQNSTVEMTWSRGTEKRKIKGYSYLFTTREDIEPEEKIMTKATNMEFYNIKPGIWRFTVKACDMEDRWSPYAQFMVNIEEIIIASTSANYQKMPTTDFSEQESAITYTVKKGDILSRVINRVLGLSQHHDYKDYLKEIVKYNDIQNPDNILPDNKILIPVLIADKETDLETIAESIFGTPKAKNRIVIQDSKSTNEIKIGDRILIRDKYFLKTGSLRMSEEKKLKDSGLGLRTESTNIMIPTPDSSPNAE